MKMLGQPEIGSKWRHWKNGKIYTVVKFAMSCDTDHEERLLVIYEDAEGGSWARSQYEWHDVMIDGIRRFTEIEPA